MPNGAGQGHRGIATGGESEPIQRYPARVLGCLRPGHLTVLVAYGQGMADGGIPLDVPMEIVPSDLRMPNSEFIVLFGQGDPRSIAVERSET